MSGYWEGKVLTSLDGSRILGNIGINWRIDCCENKFASFRDQMICDMMYTVNWFIQLLPQETQDLSHDISFSFTYSLPLHSLSDELEVTFLFLIFSHFHIFEETSLNHILLIFKKMSPKQFYPRIKMFQ